MGLPPRLRRLGDLLQSLFSADDLRWWLHVRLDRTAADELPDPDLDLLALEVAIELDRRGLIGPSLFEELIEKRPARREEILVVARVMRVDASPGTDTGPSMDAGVRADAGPPLDTDPGLPSVGARIGKYELIREVGRGGMGTVYLARDTQLGRRVAIKFLHRIQPVLRQRFLIEARALARMNHENIVTIYDVGEHGNNPYMVLEFLQGSSLRALLQKDQRMAPGRAVEIMSKVVTALAYAHQHRSVHRDLKPGNIFLTDTGSIKVLNFGIVKLVHNRPQASGLGTPSIAVRTATAREDERTGPTGATELTRADALIGTIPYLSPEQWMSVYVDHRTDLWAVGIVLFEMVAGRHPLGPLGAEINPFLVTVISDQPMPSVRDAVPDLPEALARIIDRCLCKRKEDRFGSAQELLEALEPLMPGRNVYASPGMSSLLPPSGHRSSHPPTLVSGERQAQRASIPLLAGGPASEKALLALLSELFNDNGLRQWVRLALGHEVHGALPGPSVALDELCFQLVLQAQQRGLMDQRFFEGLIDVRPGQAERIRAVAALWEDEQRAWRPNTAAQHGTSSEQWRDRPQYPDDWTHLLSGQLADAYARKHALEAAGANVAELVQEILRLKRDIRSGGQLRPGDQLGDGRYLLLERIGRGGFAHVWKAFDRVTGKHVAVKQLHGELAGDAIRRARFFRGARIMAELDHPAVVRILEPHGEDDGYHYFVMELITGGDLRQAVLQRRVDVSMVVPFLLRLGDALAKAHARRFIHRDIKPANVLLNERAEPRLTDFDLVAAGDTTGGTQTGALGTFVYAAPEMLERPQEPDARADVYGLGMTAAFMIHGSDLPRTVLRDAAGFIARLSCDEPLKRILQRAVAWEPEDRFADAAAFCQALRA